MFTISPVEYEKYMPGDLQPEAEIQVREGESGDAQRQPAVRPPGRLVKPQTAGLRHLFASHWIGVKRNQHELVE